MYHFQVSKVSLALIRCSKLAAKIAKVLMLISAISCTLNASAAAKGSNNQGIQNIEFDSLTFNTLEGLAKEGNAVAQRMLASMYEHGEGVPKDIAKAIQWYRSAADLNDDVAQFYLGYMYYQAIGFEQDYQQAFIWFAKAAAQGNADFQYNLGNLYRYGTGVAADFKTAIQWYLLAANQDQGNAQLALAILYQQGDLVPENFIKAYLWFSLASAQLETTESLASLIAIMSAEQLQIAREDLHNWQKKYR